LLKKNRKKLLQRQAALLLCVSLCMTKPILRAMRRFSGDFVLGWRLEIGRQWAALLAANERAVHLAIDGSLQNNYEKRCIDSKRALIYIARKGTPP
jgi:hypothetical protein